MLLYTTLPTILIQQFDLAFKEYETSTRLVGAVIPFVKKIAIQPRVATPSYFFLLFVVYRNLSDILHSFDLNESNSTG